MCLSVPVFVAGEALCLKAWNNHRPWCLVTANVHTVRNVCVCVRTDECKLLKALQEKACSTTDKFFHGCNTAVPSSCNALFQQSEALRVLNTHTQAFNLITWRQFVVFWFYYLLFLLPSPFCDFLLSFFNRQCTVLNYKTSSVSFLYMGLSWHNPVVAIRQIHLTVSHYILSLVTSYHQPEWHRCHIVTLNRCICL